MKKMMISCVLVASLLFNIGCYSDQTIRRGELKATTKEELKAEAEEADITVFTKGSLEYKFLKGNYRIQGDTLRGFGVQVTGCFEHNVPFHGSISFADINSLKTEKFSLGITILAIAVPVGVVVGVLVWFSASMSKI
jgi:hypothetical protein